jgi:hypothetical protein
VKAVVAYIIIKQAEKVVFQKADGNSFTEQERNADDEIHASKDHNNVRSVLRNTKTIA